MHCKNCWLATVSSLAIVGAVSSAAAADLPARVPVKAAPVVAAPAFDWTGFYIGVHGGGAWLDHKQSTRPGNGICPPSQRDCTLKVAGGMFGGLIGYNLQSGRFVYGIEADASWLGTRRSADFPDIGVAAQSPVMTMTAKVDWLATVRGRVGITMSPTLLYFTGGVAFAGVKSGWTDNDPAPANDAIFLDETRVGWVAGGGIEHAFARNWTVRVEGLYHDLGTTTRTASLPAGTYTTTFRHRIATVRGAVALRW